MCVCVHVGGYGSCFGVTGVCCGCMPMPQQPEASWAQSHLRWNINTPHACFHSKWTGICAGLKKCPSYDWAFDNILFIWGLSVPAYYLRKWLWELALHFFLFLRTCKRKTCWLWKPHYYLKWATGEIFQSAFPLQTQAHSLWNRGTKEFLNASEPSCSGSLFARQEISQRCCVTLGWLAEPGLISSVLRSRT